MRRFFIGSICVAITSASVAQNASPVSGLLEDGQNNKPLRGASITIYKKGNVSGTVSNAEGRFLFSNGGVDSVKFSMIGYSSIVYDQKQLTAKTGLHILMQPAVVSMDEVIIRPMTALEIVEQAIKNTAAVLPAADFENKAFYREVIKDREQYFSVAEAVFKAQYFVKGHEYKLSMEKGRSKEDVSYTRLFEDYHPGGGPQALLEKSLTISMPEFFDLKKTKLFQYKKDTVTAFDGKRMWIISFDQKADVHEALDKGRLYIDATDFSLVKYEAENSPIGLPYVKNLTGTDKIFAGILNIDFKRKGWKKQADFIKVNDRLLLNHAFAEYLIGYKQPKKGLDLDLVITSELAVTEPLLPLINKISGAEEWKRKNLVANLPTDFDTDFWGSENIISATTQVQDIITSISKKNNDVVVKQNIDSEWQYHQKNMFVAYSQHDSISVVPVMRSNWEDDETGGMLYREMKGDFTIETKIDIHKRSDAHALPDNGFQQSGLIIRSIAAPLENYVIIAMGTAGNSNPKIILRKTEQGRSKGPIDKIDAMNGWLRLEKKGTTLTASYKLTDDAAWKEITHYELNWLNSNLQAGIMLMARFPGNGPKMKPDMKAVFTHLNIVSNKE